MKKTIKTRAVLITTLFILGIGSIVSISAEESNGEFQPMVVPNLVEEAKKNNNWKTAFATGKHEQIVFMSISPITNPNNEIGVETHPFDQAILIVEGKGNAVLNGKTTMVKEGGLIFIPQGISHNVINLDKDKALKLISFYSDTDIPKGAVYKKKIDQPEE
jgi:quercetin dioxygenase-like cupin family protein